MRNMLQFVARLLCVAAFLCLGNNGIWAQADVWNVWNGTDKTQPARWGAGNTSFTISSAAELAWVAATVNAGTTTGSASETGFEGCTITLGTNIDLNDNEWTPIGGFTKPFKGSFDGKNHTIKNLKIENEDNSIDYAGIFGGAGNGTIQNLGVMISKQGITGKSSAGGIVGVIPELNLTIKNCFVTGGPIIVGNSAHFAGGILGFCYGICNCTIEYCYTAVEKIISTYRGGGNNIGAGGIAGNATTINNCISLTNFIHSYLGSGAVGTVDVNRINAKSGVQNCYAIPTTILNNGKTITIPSGKDENSNDGADLTKDNFKDTAGNALDGWEKAGWTLHEGQLPTLDPNAEGLPIDQFFISGSGTSVDPYMIRNNNDLRYFAIQINNSSTDYNTKSFKLNDNITFSDVWTPLGTTDRPFKGTFDGNNKTITLGIKADAKQAQAGLFGTIDKGAKVEKLAVCVTSEGITATDDGDGAMAGAIAAANFGEIDQCYVTGKGYLFAEGSGSFVGGIAGGNNGTISNCYNLIPVRVGGAEVGYSGGIAGVNGGTIEYCFAAGEVSIANQIDVEKAAGGIVGFNNEEEPYDGKVRNCVAVNLEVNGTNAHRVIGVGGNGNDVDNFSHHEMSIGITKATDPYDFLEGTALTKDNANSNAGGCFYGWNATAWKLDAIGASLPKLQYFDGQKDIPIASYLLYTVTINSVSNGILTVTRPDPLNTGGSSITVNNGDQVPYNSELTITATPSDNTYELKALTVNSSNFTNGSTHAVTGNVTVSATFKEIPKYTVTINPPSNGTISITYTDPLNPNGTKITVNNGEKVMRDTELTITATPSDNTYELKALTVNGSNFTNGSTHKVAGDVTVSATIEKIPKYTVTINPPSNGIISITHPDPLNSTGTITVNNGDNVMRDIELTIKATPASGYKLKALTVNSSSFTSGATHKVADNVTVSATFEAETVDPGPIDPDPTPTPPQPTVYYTVTLPSVEGVATDPVAGEHEVESWSNFRFSLTLDSAYNQSVPVVTTDRGETLTPRQSDGAYILNQVRSDVEIYISGIVKNPDPVANEVIKATAAKVWITNNHLHLQSPVDADAYIYTAAGNQQAICHLTAGQQETIQLPAGIYFVRIGNERFKVRL